MASEDAEASGSNPERCRFVMDSSSNLVTAPRLRSSGSLLAMKMLLPPFAVRAVLAAIAVAPPGPLALRAQTPGIPAASSQIDVAGNRHPVGTTGPLPSSGVMHRDGIRGTEIESSIPFDESMLVAGKNVPELTIHARGWVQGVLYDYLRLEIEESTANTMSLH